MYARPPMLREYTYHENTYAFYHRAVYDKWLWWWINVHTYMNPVHPCLAQIHTYMHLAALFLALLFLRTCLFCEKACIIRMLPTDETDSVPHIHKMKNSIIGDGSGGPGGHMPP